MYNVPDDWGSYYTNCMYCSRKFHASEGCDCRDDMTECDHCGEWHDDDRLTTVGKEKLCRDCVDDELDPAEAGFLERRGLR